VAAATNLIKEIEEQQTSRTVVIGQSVYHHCWWGTIWCHHRIKANARAPVLIGVLLSLAAGELLGALR